MSIIIPTYFRDENLEESIKSALSQTYADIEVIVVDDSGEEYARPICEQYPIRYVPKIENEGQIAAWNTGFEQATGDYIQLLDDDDRMFNQKVEKQIRILENQDDVGVVHCGIRWDFGVDDYPHKELQGDVLKQILTLDTSPCITSTLLTDAELLNDIMPLDIYPASTDDVLKIELSKRSEFELVDEILVHRGTGDGNISTSIKPIVANKKILSDYSELYDQFDDQVRKRARSKTLYREGMAHLEENIWSLKAIIAFGESIRVAPRRSIRPLVIFLLSFGGQPAISTFEWIGSKLKNMLQSISTGLRQAD